MREDPNAVSSGDGVTGSEGGWCGGGKGAEGGLFAPKGGNSSTFEWIGKGPVKNEIQGKHRNGLRGLSGKRGLSRRVALASSVQQGTSPAGDADVESN